MKTKPIKIALAVEGWFVPAWVESVVRRVRDEGFAQWSLIVLIPHGGAARHGSVLQQGLEAAYLWLDQHLSPAERDPLAAVDIRPLLSGTSVRYEPGTSHAPEHRGGRAEEGDGNDPGESGEPIDVDLVVNFTASPLCQELVSSAPLGEWRYRHGVRRACDPNRVGLVENVEGQEANVSVLEMLAPCSRTARTLATMHTAVDRLSAARNRANCYWPAVSLLPRQLARLAAIGAEEYRRQLGTGENELNSDDSRSIAPSPGGLAAGIARTSVRRIRRKFEKWFCHDEWFLLSHFDAEATGPCIEPSKFQPVYPPHDRFWADPHVVVNDGRHFVFFEDYCYQSRKAHISVVEREPSGNWGPAQVALDRPYHLSYPFVFQWQGQYYMLPESAANKTLELYRCDRFPDRWSLHKVIWRNVQAFDATLVECAGHWWMFVAMAENEGGSSWDELFLFHADQPLSDHWLPHPCNPIVSDVRRARPAGGVLTHAGQLVRPAQDGARNYGYAMRWMRIDRLSPTEYAETEVARLTPDACGWQAMHTLSYGAGLTMMDAQRLRLRWSRGEDRSDRNERAASSEVMGDWAAPEAV